MNFLFCVLSLICIFGISTIPVGIACEVWNMIPEQLTLNNAQL